MFSTTEREPHSVRKRMISNVYSKSYLQSSPEVHEISHSLIRKRLLPLLNIFAETERSVDVLELNHAIAMDFICAYLFGLSSGTNFIQDAKYRKHWLDQYKRRKSPHTFWTAELPALRSLLEKIGIMVIPAYIKSANREIERSCYNMCQSAEDSIYKAEANPTSPVVYKQLSQSLEKTHAESGNTDSYPKSLKVASEMLDHLAAGQETTGITLTYVMYCLSQRPALQFALREELVTFSSSLRFQSTSATDTVSAPDLPSARSLDALPLLHAVLMETLRLHTAIPGPQPRLTPHNPAIPTKLGEYGSIPGGVRVSALGYTLHRSEKAFPEPEQWKPERWLNAEKDQKEEMLRWFWAFGSGGRMCIGSNFAMMEMKLVLAAIYVNFTTAIVDDAGIEQADRYTASPVSKKLILRLTRVS
ncbi:hypothetical protein MMC14_010368 [Varicellaria rhodocarpa]|nr:hypothetical protein [Varicellaria rhodocarpa]